VDKQMNIISSSKQFLHEVRVEMSKVIWPSFDEFVGSTIVVLFLVAVIALYLGLLDAVLSVIIRNIFKMAI
jgi:preprotein translocase subunit SecE